MNIKQFQYVLTLVREGSFSKAAEALNISQPSLSQYIKKIEREVGLELFDRTNGEVKITDAGRIYIEAGQRILAIEHQMENAFTDLAEHKSGSLIIGVAPYRAAGMMPTIAAAFKKLYPGVHLVVREGTTAELIEGMEHGTYDLALSLLPVDDQLFFCEKVMEEELVLAVPAAHPALRATAMEGRKHPAVEARVLNGQAMVMLTETQFMQRQLQKMMREYNLNLRPAAVVKSLEAQIEMVKAGVGLALMPSGIERFCSDGSVRFYSFTNPLPKRELVLIWRRDRALSQVAEDLKQMICQMEW